MSMVVKNNMSAITTLNTLNKNSSALSKSLQKVSSGMKINSAADDASGYAISERMRVQIRSLDQANANTQSGNSMMKVAEGAVSSTVDILKTLKEKVINAANDTNTDSDRLTIQKELNQSIDQIDDNALVTYNGKYLVDGSKNTAGNATYTALSNQQLSTSTTADTKLTDLMNRNDENLEILATDKVTVSYVQAGRTYSTQFQVGADSKLQDIFDKAEAIDNTSNVFGGKYNSSVYAANSGKTVLDNDSTYQSMAFEADSADSFLKNYNTANDKLTEATNNVISAANALINAANADTTGQYQADNLGSAFGSNSTVSNVKDALAYIANKSAYFGDANASSLNASTGPATSDTKAMNYRDDADVSAAITALAAAVSAYNGYNITSGSEASKVSTSGSLGAKDNGGNAASALAVYNALDDNVYSAFGSKGFGSNTGAINNATDAFSTCKYSAFADTGSSASNADANYTAADGTGDTMSGRVMAMAAYAKGLTQTSLLTGANVGVAASNDMKTTADETNAITVTANNSGVGGQISGFNISISDSEGNVKKSANASLDSWSETIRAQNKSEDNSISLHVGAAANQSIKVGLTDMRSEALGLKGADGTKLNISTQVKANAAVNVLDNAIQKALDQQTTIGSIESRLSYTSSNLTTASENVQASESTIRDADMAKEMTEYTKNNVLLQAAQSMLAQANQSSSSVLSLLQ